MREFCCTECGLIWFDEKMIANEVTCPGCGNINGKEPHHIYACDTTGWFYISENAVKDLHERNKKIHYYRDHPWYGKEE